MDMRDTEETVDVTPTEPSGGRGRRALGLGVTLAVVVALLAGFGALALSKHAPTLAPQTEPGSTAGWQVYHDPLNLFTMRLPPGWTASADLGSFTEGDRNGSDSGQDEMISFHDPSQGKSSAGIFIVAQQIHNTTFAQAMMCSARSHETTTFHGYPADESSPAMILFESANAHFQLDEIIPGVLEPVHSSPMQTAPLPPTPTTLPAATISTDRALLSDALASFQPTDTQPLACH
ncbi:MAG TPA: hypothetical protein VHI51_04935 [Ktedonobacterales bacterium]|nr:hypothetical protein [Ktedonobacterales bacterium]